MNSLAPAPTLLIENRILLVRGQKVLIDSDLAELYGVPTKALNQAVKRNALRFPSDFMFRLTMEEARHIERLRSQTVTLNPDGTLPDASSSRVLWSQNVTLETVPIEKRGRHTKYTPNVFTEHGIAMLSSVLTSERAILVNIEIVRSFLRLRQLISQNEDLALRLEQLETRHNQDISLVFETIEHLRNAPPDTPDNRRRIGFPLNRSRI
jgi:hypothetical protein